MVHRMEHDSYKTVVFRSKQASALQGGLVPTQGLRGASELTMGVGSESEHS